MLVVALTIMIIIIKIILFSLLLLLLILLLPYPYCPIIIIITFISSAKEVMFTDVNIVLEEEVILMSFLCQYFYYIIDHIALAEVSAL